METVFVTGGYSETFFVTSGYTDTTFFSLLYTHYVHISTWDFGKYSFCVEFGSL